MMKTKNWSDEVLLSQAHHSQFYDIIVYLSRQQTTFLRNAYNDNV